MNVEKAVAFVEAHGDAAHTALARYAVGRASPDEVIAAIRPFQRPDGSWAGIDKDMSGAVSSISQTWIGLQWLIWLRPVGAELIDPTVAFLKRVQRNAGYWDEPDEIAAYNPPHWMMPGNHSNQLWLTAAGLCKLKELGCEADVNVERALEFLRAGWLRDEGRFPDFIHPHWMAYPLLYDSPQPFDREIAAGCRAFLVAAMDQGIVDPYDYHSIAYAARLTGDQALFERAVARIESDQQPDGGMTTHYGDQHRPNGTVEVLYLLRER